MVDQQAAEYTADAGIVVANENTITHGVRSLPRGAVSLGEEVGGIGSDILSEFASSMSQRL
jgi:hypothetical protein